MKDKDDKGKGKPFGGKETASEEKAEAAERMKGRKKSRKGGRGGRY
jgi:hypothetical protein